MTEKKSTKKPGKATDNPLLMELSDRLADSALQIVIHDMKAAGDVTTHKTRTIIHIGIRAAFLAGFNLGSAQRK